MHEVRFGFWQLKKIIMHFSWCTTRTKGRHQHTQQRMTQDDKSLPTLVVWFVLVVHTLAAPLTICGRPQFDTMVYDGPIKRATPGTIAVVQCSSKYHERSFLVTCQSNGKWSRPEGECQLVTCPLPELKLNSILDMSGRAYNDTATYECTEGFWQNGTKTMKCQRDGTWTSTHGNCEVKERMNGKISAKDGKFGVLHCHEGYMMTGSNVTICKNKTWIRLLGKFTQDESTHSTPAKRCPQVKEVKNGNISAIDGKFGDRIVLQCHEGYVVIGSNVTLCTSNKTWSSVLGGCVPDESPNRALNLFLPIAVPCIVIICILLVMIGVTVHVKWRRMMNCKREEQDREMQDNDGASESMVKSKSTKTSTFQPEDKFSPDA